MISTDELLTGVALGGSLGDIDHAQTKQRGEIPNRFRKKKEQSLSTSSQTLPAVSGWETVTGTKVSATSIPRRRKSSKRKSQKKSQKSPLKATPKRTPLKNKNQSNIMSEVQLSTEKPKFETASPNAVCSTNEDLDTLRSPILSPFSQVVKKAVSYLSILF